MTISLPSGIADFNLLTFGCCYHVEAPLQPMTIGSLVARTALLSLVWMVRGTFGIVADNLARIKLVKTTLRVQVGFSNCKQSRFSSIGDLNFHFKFAFGKAV